MDNIDETQHCAIDARLNPSEYVSEVIVKEIARTPGMESLMLLDALGNAKLAGLDLEFPRDTGAARAALPML